MWTKIDFKNWKITLRFPAILSFAFTKISKFLMYLKMKLITLLSIVNPCDLKVTFSRKGKKLLLGRMRPCKLQAVIKSVPKITQKLCDEISN